MLVAGDDFLPGCQRANECLLRSTKNSLRFMHKKCVLRESLNNPSEGRKTINVPFH